MRDVFDGIARLAHSSPSRMAVHDDHGTVTYHTLASRVGALAAALSRDAATVAVTGSAGASWIVADLAATLAGARVVPVPDFFSSRQVRHVLADARVNMVLRCGESGNVQHAGALAGLPVLEVDAFAAGSEPSALLAHQGGSERLIYTSGTTGAPKGVLHGDDQLGHAVRAIAGAVRITPADRHLSALPSSLLLEQIAGVFIPLSAGASVHVSARAIGAALGGDMAPLEAAFSRVQPTTTILVPQLLAALTARAVTGAWTPPPTLRFAAVGGAPVPLAQVRAARDAGIAVIRGYGLSECASVVAVERPDEPWQDVEGLCGQPLDGLSLSISDGEVVVHGPTVMKGYLNGEALTGSTWRTGDRGTLRCDGSLVVHGRMDRVLVLPSGRNVQADWVEGVVLADPRVSAARLSLSAEGILELECRLRPVPASPAALREALDERLAVLPDYARPRHVHLLTAPEAVAPVHGSRAGFPEAASGVPPPINEERSLHRKSFYDDLLERTESARRQFMALPLINEALENGVSRTVYLRYLEQAYHHVRHTCPLLGAALAHCSKDDEALREALLEYLQEERGHERWILDDIAALGGDAGAVRDGEGGDAVRVMVGYAYHVTERVSPYALLGMVHVLEGVSVAIAQRAATSIRDALGDGQAGGFSYLESHGALDQEHVAFFQKLVDGIQEPVHQRAIIDTARIMYGLYGEVFRELEGHLPAARHAA